MSIAIDISKLESDISKVTSRNLEIKEQTKTINETELKELKSNSEQIAKRIKSINTKLNESTGKINNGLASVKAAADKLNEETTNAAKGGK